MRGLVVLVSLFLASCSASCAVRGRDVAEADLPGDITWGGACQVRESIYYSPVCPTDTLIWPSLPLHVFIRTPDVPGAAAVRYRIVLAMQAWNRAVGTQVFVLDEEITDETNVAVMFGPSDGLPPGAIAGTMHARIDGRLLSVVTFVHLEGYDLTIVAVHELGHVLGLGHDTNPASVMYPEYIDEAQTSEQRRYEITRKDVAAIRDRYGVAAR